MEKGTERYTVRKRVIKREGGRVENKRGRRREQKEEAVS